MSGLLEVVPVHKETACISMLVADYAQLGQVNFDGCTLLLLCVKDVSEIVYNMCTLCMCVYIVCYKHRVIICYAGVFSDRYGGHIA